ncbi:MAG: NADH-quinone oxidoreductase subunit J [Anaerolineales bacterium]
MIYAFLILGVLFFTLYALWSQRLVTTVIALAAISGLASVILYLMGAHFAAVIELSVGAGLVAVLFAFTNSLLPQNMTERLPTIVPPLVAGLLAAGITFIVGLLLVHQIGEPASSGTASDFEAVFWGQRSADVFVQLVIIFAGALGVLGLLGDEKATHTTPVTTSDELTTIEGES